MKTTEKQKKFCLEYLKDLNATQAAIRAGFSKKTASEIGYEYLRKPQIKIFIDKQLDEAMEESKSVLKLRILKELQTVAFADITEDINIITVDSKDAEGKPVKLQTVEIKDTKDSSISAVIAGIKISEKGHIEIKYHDKMKAIEDLGKYLAMWTENKNIKLDVDEAVIEKLQQLYDSK